MNTPIIVKRDNDFYRVIEIQENGNYSVKRLNRDMTEDKRVKYHTFSFEPKTCEVVQMEMSDRGKILIDQYGGQWLIITEYREILGYTYRVVSMSGAFLSEAQGHTLEHLVKDLESIEEIKITKIKINMFIGEIEE